MGKKGGGSGVKNRDRPSWRSGQGVRRYILFVLGYLFLWSCMWPPHAFSVHTVCYCKGYETLGSSVQFSCAYAGVIDGEASSRPSVRSWFGSFRCVLSTKYLRLASHIALSFMHSCFEIFHSSHCCIHYDTACFQLTPIPIHFR